MSNKSIAISWASKQVKSASGFVYSNAFFKPFSNTNTRKKIVEELKLQNVVVWTDTKDGAFLFKKGDSRLKIHTVGNQQGAIWCEGDNRMILPIVEV
jgi:hypothetical protein